MTLKQKIDSLIAPAVVLGGLLLVGGLLNAPHFDRETHTVRITDKERVPHGESSRYMIYGLQENGDPRVFKNVDSWVEFKVNSSDVQTRLEIGKTYEFATYGFRRNWPTAYENVLTAKEVPAFAPVAPIE